jgi:hypothetical protein
MAPGTIRIEVSDACDEAADSDDIDSDEEDEDEKDAD